MSETMSGTMNSVTGAPTRGVWSPIFALQVLVEWLPPAVVMLVAVAFLTGLRSSGACFMH